MRKRAIVTVSLILPLLLIVGVWWALAADASDVSGPTPIVRVNNPQRLLLVFTNDASSDPFRVIDPSVEVADAYRVVESAARAANVERHLNRMARMGYRYHTAIQVVAPQASAQYRRIPTGASSVYQSSMPTPRMPARETEWVTRPGSGSQYRVIGAGAWNECEAAAREQGAHLVTINDAEEQAWLAETYGDRRFVWIGMTDDGDEGVWRWASGEASDFTNWAPMTDEPNNLWESGEHFAHMNWLQPGLWNDLGPASVEWASVTHGIIERALTAE